MKNFFRSYRPVLMGTRWMVTADHPLAVQAAASVLDQGGDAVDAAVQANLVMAVVNPHMCGIGGDLFALVYRENRRQVRALDAAGFAPAGADLDSYARLGLDQIPATGIHSCTVPGALAGWQALLESYGSWGLDTLIGRAVGLAREGFPAYEKLVNSIINKREFLEKSPAAAAIFLPHGSPPQVGQLIRQPGLADALELIAEQGPDALYRGSLGDALVQHSGELNGLFRATDLEDYRVIWKDPLTASYRGYTICTQPPPSQGLALLMQAQILEQSRVKSMVPGSAELLHIMIEAKKLAFGERDRVICDPGFHQIPLDRLLDPDHGRYQADQIGDQAHEQICKHRFARGGEDTVYLMVVDDRGNAVVLIQSLFQEFGSCVMVPQSGMLLHNRARGFSMNQSHPCRLEPRKRPYHTLHPLMLLDQGRPCLLLGSPGGDGQTQTNIQVLVNLIDFGVDVQAAVDAPRWRSMPDGRLLLEGRYTEPIVDQLAQRGHRVHTVEGFDPVMGSAQALSIDRDAGVLLGGADGRRMGYGLGR